jgi:hypothetical protein
MSASGGTGSRIAAGLLVAVGIGSVGVPPAAHAAQVLITEAEGRLPPQKGATPLGRRGVTRGPKIELVDTATEGVVHSPMHLQLKFQAFGGAKIDPAAVHLMYLKSPEVDLTDRIKPFVQTSGIDMPDAVLPPGDHVLRVDVKDTDGHTASTSFTLKVAE